MQVDLTTRKLKTLAKRLASDLSFTSDQRRRALDALARGLGHPSFAALKPALDDPAPRPETDPVQTARAVLKDPAALDIDQADRLEDAVVQFLRARGKALCLMGDGDVAAAIAMAEDRDEIPEDEVRARDWLDGHLGELEDSMVREANQAIEELLAIDPPKTIPTDTGTEPEMPGPDAYLVLITAAPAWPDAPDDPAVAAARLSYPEDADVMTQRLYWTIVDATSAATAREHALDVFHATVPIRSLEEFDITSTPVATGRPIPGYAAYCEGRYAPTLAYIFLGRLTR